MIVIEYNIDALSILDPIETQYLKKKHICQQRCSKKKIKKCTIKSLSISFQIDNNDFELNLNEMSKLACAIFFIIAFAEFQQSEGHGMLLDPVNRASRWRFNSSAPADYNDNEGFCGGFNVS